jgi:hypothetical protein
MTKLPDTQLRVLRAAADGDVYRSHASNNLNESFNRADQRRKVTAIVAKLTDRPEPLLKIGERERWGTPWIVTDAGRTVLAEADARHVADGA